ncbi:MAG: geranylgeranyl reductase family protein [Halobacteriales archaeon]
MYDFVVVGAGPAGSHFAHKSAELGNKIVVFEGGVVGAPLSCSGHVSLDLWKYISDKNKSKLIQNEIFGARFHVNGSNGKAHTFYKNEPISNVIDRVELDRCLSKMAIDSGAEIEERSTVIGVKELKERVVVKVRGPDGKQEVNTKMVVGCDGPNSRVRRSLGIREPDELLHGILGFEPTVDFGNFVDVHLNVPRFFSWRIPRGNAGVEYGIAGSPDIDIIGEFEKLIDSQGVQVENRCSGMIPIGPPRSISTKRGFLIGDAASQTKPFTGGGIVYSLIASDCAASVVNPNKIDTIGIYEQSWRKKIGREIEMGKWIRKGYSLPRVVQKIGLQVFSGEIGVHMDRPTSLFSRKQFEAMKGSKKLK